MKLTSILALSMSLLIPVAACGDGAPAVDNTPPATAKAAAERMFAAVESRELGNIWTLMPSSYRADLKGLLASLSTKVDQESYDSSMKTMGDLVDTMKAKQSLLVDLVKQQAGGAVPPNVDLPKMIAGITDLLDGVVGSDRLATTKGLAELDVAAFLNETGQKIIPAVISLGEMQGASEKDKEIFDILTGKTQVVVTEKSADSDKAELEIAMGDQKELLRLVKVGDHWVPEEMQRDWSRGIAEMRKEVEKMPAMAAKDKIALKNILGMVDKLLADAKTAESPEELMEMFERSPLAATAMGMMGGR